MKIHLKLRNHPKHLLMSNISLRFVSTLTNNINNNNSNKNNKNNNNNELFLVIECSRTDEHMSNRNVKRKPRIT